MKKLISTALITLALAANTVFAATLTDTYVREEVTKQIVEQNKKYTDAELKVIIASMPFKTITVSDGKLKFVVTSNFDKFVPRDIKKVYIYSNGHLETEFIVSVRTLAYKNVLCARTQLDREALLSSANVISKKMEVSANIDYILTEKMLQNKIDEKIREKSNKKNRKNKYEFDYNKYYQNELNINRSKREKLRHFLNLWYFIQ